MNESSFKKTKKRKVDFKMKNIMKLVRDENGQTMVEYGLLIALISIAVIAVLVLLGPRIAGFFRSVDNQLASSTPATTP